ncbi:MAG TPA: hypothetical protein VIU61_17005 [Kofleriaceae bacterium]
MRAWARRTAELHDELVALAEPDPRWWLLAGGAAVAERAPARAGYIIADAEPTADTFLGHVAPPAADPFAEAIARARAARTAIRELDGTLPEQPLAVTIAEHGGRAVTRPSTLTHAAFAIGDRCIVAELDAITPAQLMKSDIVSAHDVQPVRRSDGEPHSPFVCVSIGDDPLATARHGHRRAWIGGAGPWLGLGRSGELATVSTCHMVVDGYGHARLAARIAELAPPVPGAAAELRPLAPVAGGIPLGIAWRELAHPAPRVVPLAYALGRILHRATGRPDAPFSPTFQIPVAPGDRSDPMRRRRRVIQPSFSVRFLAGEPEPMAAFEARTRDRLDREARGTGLTARLLAAARAAPAPLAWKRRTMSVHRPRWLDRFAEVIGGRACLSRIRLDVPLAPTCAVSSPARLVTSNDPLGGCVITILDDGTRSAITACGSGLAGTPAAAASLIDELLEVAIG